MDRFDVYRSVPDNLRKTIALLVTSGDLLMNTTRTTRTQKSFLDQARDIFGFALLVSVLSGILLWNIHEHKEAIQWCLITTAIFIAKLTKWI